MATTRRDKPIKLDALDPSQYHYWAAKAKATFQIFRVYDVIDGTTPDPTPEGVDSNDPTSAPYLALTARQRQQIEDWK